MHTPQCPGFYGGIPTIPLPVRGNYVDVPAGSGPTELGLPVTKGLALWVSSADPCTLRLTYGGSAGTELVLYLEPGTHRILVPETYESSYLTRANGGKATAWIEDLSALRKSRDE